MKFPICAFCGQAAACFGAYEGHEPTFACGDCCGHGCEDGHCDLLSDELDPELEALLENDSIGGC